jgi:hypothetical protein
MAPREELLSDSDSDDGSPAARPTASRPKSKSAPPKSAKTAVQAGRARAAVASDDGMDSDASDEAGDDGRLQLVMHQLSKQKTTTQKKADRKLQRSVAEFELTVGTALSDLSNTLDSELAEHDKRCKAMHKSTADSLRKIKATEEKVTKQRKEFEQAAQELARKIRKDIANANEVKLPQSKAVTAAVDKDVAKLRGIAKRHAKQHETVVAISLPWEKLAGIIQHWGQEESNKCLRSLEATGA